MKKVLSVVLLAMLTLGVFGGCGKVETPAAGDLEIIETARLETKAETPADVLAGEERVYEGKFWDPMSSMSQTELEASDDVYFINTQLDHKDGEFEVTVSKMHFVEDGILVELNLDNGTDTPRTNIILKEFSMNEIIDKDEKTDASTEVVLFEKVKVGAFKDVVVNAGEAKQITFVVPYDLLQNEIYNFNRVNYSWFFDVSETDVYNLKSLNAETDTLIETPNN